MRILYKKPKITEKKIKLNMFFRNRFIDSATNFKSSLAAGFDTSCLGCWDCTCFLRGTRVLLSDNTVQEIESIQKGDKVFSYNLEKRELVEGVVSELIIHEKAKEYLVINNILKVTPEHIVCINEKWQPVGGIKIGDSLLNSAGVKVLVESIQRVEEEVGPVYNLHLENEEHNYFAEDILVHNYKSACLSFSTKIATPFGNINVREIRVGQLIWTVSAGGEKVMASVEKISKIAVPKTHQVCHLVLEDGRELLVSLLHPTVLDGSLADLKVGQEYDGSVIAKLDLVPYNNGHTYDLLPAGDTGFYWANGILMGSTLKNVIHRKDCLSAGAGIAFI